MKEMAALKRRYGYRRIRILLRREVWQKSADMNLVVLFPNCHGAGVSRQHNFMAGR